MKQRFTSIDVRAMVRSIRPRLLGAKVANIYDVNNKSYILKFTSATATVDTDETTENKWFLVLEAGVRFNLTDYDRGNSSALPSAWTMKLRKLLRGKRLGDMRQVGSDRVIIMEFGAGEKAVIIALEMYAKGNIVVMDNTYKVTMLLRRYAYSDEEKVEVGLPYPLELAAKKGETTTGGEEGKYVDSISEEVLVKELGGRSNVKGMSSAVLRLVSFASPQLATLSVRNAMMQEGEEEPSKILRRAIGWCYEALNEVSTIKEGKGYGLEEGEGGKMVDYAPLKRLLKGGGDDSSVVEYPSFTECVDDYYTRLMRAQLEGQLVQKQSQMISKVENIKSDQRRRMGELEKEQQSLWEQAVALEANTTLADAAIQMVNALLAAKLRWDELTIAVKQQQRAGHPLAMHIRQLALDKNRISIVLEKAASTDDDDDGATTVEVWLDLGRTAQANVALLHEKRKGMQEKMGKTEEQMARAVKMAEKRLKGKGAGGNQAAAALGGAEKQLLAKRRKKFWFQKFFWFISSDRLLVLAGRDAQQNELLWRRYLAPTDIYVHADLAGAATVVIKMPKGGVEPPQRTLAEAGQYSLCRSRAWDNKIVTSAWWVWAKQVSKTAPTGEFLSTGSFMIRGKKNFLPPTGRLEMGLGVMWTVTDDSAEKYRAKRVQRENLLEEEEKERRIVSTEEAEEEGPGVVEDFDFNPKGGEGPIKKGGKEEGGQASKGGGMSRQQRKQMKKAGVHKQGGDTESSADGQRGDKEQAGGKTKPLTRHQRKKLAKIREKYGDQDEEERLIRMKLMGSKEVKVVEEQQQQQQRQDEEEDDDVVEEASSKDVTTGKNICFKCGEEGHLASACPNAAAEAQANSSRQVDDHEEEEEEEEDEEEAKVTSGGGIAHTLDRLQSWPEWGEDEVLGAVMVCAPYQAMTQIPIKVKFTPGQMKRGKAAQLGLKLLQSQVEGELKSARAAAAAKAPEGEDGVEATPAAIDRHALDLVRLVPMEEASDAIGVSNVKLAASGVQKLQQKSKKEKKQLAKQREKEALLAMDG